MEIKKLEESMEENDHKIKVSNFRDSFLKDVFYAGYKARMKQELSLEALAGNRIHKHGYKWTYLKFWRRMYWRPILRKVCRRTLPHI